MNTKQISPPVTMSDVTIRGDRITLRAYRPGDVDALVQYADNRKVWRNLEDTFPSPYTRANAEEWVAFAASRAPLTAAIEYNGEAVGGIGYERLSGVFRCTAKIGYWLGEPFWGRGIATEALRLATAYAFEQDDLIRLQAWVYEWNPASARVLEKAGYILEGRMRRAVIKDDRNIDAFMYARVRD